MRPDGVPDQVTRRPGGGAMKKFIPKPPVKNLKTLLKVLASGPSYLHVVGKKYAFVALIEYKWEGEEKSRYVGTGFYEWRGTVSWPLKTALKAVEKGLVVEAFSHRFDNGPDDFAKGYKGIPF